MKKCVSLSAQQKGAHLEERAEQITWQSDTLPWQRGEGGMWQEGAEEGGGRKRRSVCEGGTTKHTVSCIWLLMKKMKLLSGSTRGKTVSGEEILGDLCNYFF